MLLRLVFNNDDIYYICKFLGMKRRIEFVVGRKKQ